MAAARSRSLRCVFPEPAPHPPELVSLGAGSLPAGLAVGDEWRESGAAEGWRVGLWEQLAVPAVSFATTPRVHACVRVLGAGSAVSWQRPHKPAPTRCLLAACPPAPPTSGFPPSPRPIYNQFPG